MNNGNLNDWTQLASAHIEAHHRRQILQQEAETERLVREYRRGHPEVLLRSRLARLLRRIADRLAPLEPARASRGLQLIPESQPSPTH